MLHARRGQILTSAVRATLQVLLKAALREAANQRFMMLDETTIPLYPPQLVWSQFMGESKSRMSACEVHSGCSARSPQAVPGSGRISVPPPPSPPPPPPPRGGCCCDASASHQQSNVADLLSERQTC